MSNKWCPIIFSSICREKNWGGTLLRDDLARPLSNGNEPIGESYEIIDHEDYQSVAQNAPFSGSTLRELVESNPKEIVGTSHVGSKPFPLTIKYIDARQRLPLQVHPADLENGPNGSVHPNTKMWYLIACQPGAVVYAGLKRSPTRQQFLSRIGSDGLEELVQSFQSEPGDAYFISAGRVHAVGGGNLIFVVQQNIYPPYCISNEGTSDTVDSDTLPDIQAGFNAIHFQDRTLMRICGERSSAERNRRISLITTCPYFAIDELRLVNDYHDGTDGATFHLLTAVNRNFSIKAGDAILTINRGQTCLIPAAAGYYTLTPQNSTAKILKTALRTI